jgi:hypothetical protein
MDSQLVALKCFPKDGYCIFQGGSHAEGNFIRVYVPNSAALAAGPGEPDDTPPLKTLIYLHGFALSMPGFYDKHIEEFVKHGYDLKDAMSIMLSNYSKTDPKYTPEYIISLEDNFDKLFVRLIKEKQENRNMAYEDDDSARTINLLRQ